MPWKGWKSGFIEKCRVCGKESYYHPCRSKGNKHGYYCSKDCWDSFMRNNRIGHKQTSESRERIKVGHQKGKTVKCDFCGTLVYKSPANLKGYSHHFCSTKCSGSYHYREGQQKIPRVTSIERTIQAIVLGKNLPYQYVGDGQIWIDRMNPDFIHSTKKEVIEIFGCWFHGCKTCFPKGGFHKVQDDSSTRIQRFKNAGYDCKVIWGA